MDFVGGGGVRSGCRGRGTWLFLRWSGVAGGDEGGEEGASVGDDDTDGDANGMEAGSNSRSGMGGDSNGRRVILSMNRRRTAL